MTKKQLFPILTSAILITSPMLIVVSCSKQNSFYDENGMNVVQGFKANQIKVQINLNNEEEFKISQLNNAKFNFKVDESILEEDEKTKELYRKLVHSLSKTNISFVDFYIPKFNDDKNSYVLFKINKLDDLVYVKISDLIIKNKNNMDVPIVLLNEEEIKLLTIEKLNKQIFIPNLSTKVEYFFKNKFAFNNDEFNENWWNQNKNNLNEELKYNLKQWFIDTYLCFNENYGNIQISNLNLLFNKLKNDTKIEANFKISTSSLENYPNCAYEIKLTLWRSHIYKTIDEINVDYVLLKNKLDEIIKISNKNKEMLINNLNNAKEDFKKILNINENMIDFEFMKDNENNKEVIVIILQRVNEVNAKNNIFSEIIVSENKIFYKGNFGLT